MTHHYILPSLECEWLKTFSVLLEYLNITIIQEEYYVKKYDSIKKHREWIILLLRKIKAEGKKQNSQLCKHLNVRYTWKNRVMFHFKYLKFVMDICFKGTFSTVCTTKHAMTNKSLQQSILQLKCKIVMRFFFFWIKQKSSNAIKVFIRPSSFKNSYVY